MACRPIINIGTFSWAIGHRVPNSISADGTNARIVIKLDETDY